MTTYINRRSGSDIETVDEFETRREAIAMECEYNMSDPSAIYYVSQRATKDWRETQ